MTNIELTISNELISLNMTGHAGHAERGSDIVCSAISTLEYIIYAYVESNPEQATIKRYESDTGYSYMRIIPKGQGIYETLKAVHLGFVAISEMYPENVNYKQILKSGRN